MKPTIIEIKARFKPIKRKIPFMCQGIHAPHLSQGTPHTINNQGPFCGLCVTGIFIYPIEKEYNNA